MTRLLLNIQITAIGIRRAEKRAEINVVINICGAYRLEKFLNTIKPNINLGFRRSDGKERNQSFGSLNLNKIRIGYLNIAFACGVFCL